MKQTQRHHEILELLTQQGFMSTEAFVENFNVSPQTIRRDLNDLATQGRISRHHGGASLYSSTENDAYSTRQIQYHAEKERIAKRLAEQVPNGASLFIDIGTTTEAVAKALLNHKGLRIVTNNINVASILIAKEDFTVVVAGGEVRNKDGGIIGEATREFIDQFRMDIGIIGISGIHNDGSLLDFDYNEVKVAQAIIANSGTIMLAADRSKFGRNAMVNLGNISQVDYLFTDAEPSIELAEKMREHGVELHVC